MATREDCIFCKIATGEVPATKLLEENRIIAFKDISPAAPFHALVIPREHIETTNDLEGSHRDLVGEMVLAGKKLAREAGIDESGYRLIMNCNADAGQLVFHIHLHVLGGRNLGALLPQ
jgi:histidine triad (HIT) family protein